MVVRDLAALCLLFLAGANSPSRAQTESPVELAHRRGIQVPMRDGVVLAADAILPAAAGGYPTILIRTPYGRDAALAAWGAESLARRGFAVVAQDVRGKGDSEGEFDLPWVGEGPDGYDTIEWAASQPWSNGRVGTLGGSYLGQVQWAAAVLRPPSLKTMFVFPAISDPFFGGPYDSGVFSLSPFWAYENEGRRPREVPDFQEDDFFTLPLSRLDEAMFGESVALWDRYLDLDTQDSWDAVHWPEDLSRVEVPVLHVMALWDGDGIGPILNWSALRHRDDQWLVFGPWGHSMNQNGRRGDVSYGSESRIAFPELIADWFDAWLKDGGSSFSEPRARVFLTGRNEWREFDDWPPSDAQVVAYHLVPPAQEHGPGRLSSAPPEASVARYFYDPAAPRGMGFRESLLVDTTKVPFPLAAEDVRSFQTEPLKEPLVLGAPVELQLSFSTSAEDTDFFALLVDIDASGEERALTHPGKIRARFLRGWSEPRALVPDRRYTTTLRLWDVAHEFQAGHRIGLVIRSDWFPRWSRNLNTLEPIATAEEPEWADQTVYCGGPDGSQLRLRRLAAD